MIRRLALLAVLAASLSLPFAHAQLGTGESPIERSFTEVKFLDAYFGTSDEKLEFSPGDSNVPFTVVMANVGTHDIVGARGQLSLPFGFGSEGSDGSVIVADSEASVKAGDHFYLTFYVDIEDSTSIGSYPASIKVDYSRIREAGMRASHFAFDFKVVGESIINMRATDPFLDSFEENDVIMSISNDGTATAAGIDVELKNTIDAVPASGPVMSNIENVVVLNSNWNVGNIDPGSSRNIAVGLYVPGSLASQTVSLPMEITYFNAHGDPTTLSRTVDLYVRGLVDITIYDVRIIELSGKPTIVGQIINEGNEDALFGFATIKPRGSSNIAESTQFLDELEVDSPVPFNVPVEFNGPPSYGEHEIEVIVRYKDGLRDESTVSYDATVYVPEPAVIEQAQGEELFPVIIIAAVVIAGIYAVKRRKRRKQA